MKHRTSQALFEYWNEIRGNHRAPHRFDIEPARIARILPETFILELSPAGTYTFRLAGTRICDQLGRELRDTNFIDLMGVQDRVVVTRVLEAVTEQCAVGVLEIRALTEHRQFADFEILLLPLTYTGSTVARFLGSMAAMDPPAWLGSARLEPHHVLQHRLFWPDGNLLSSTAPDDPQSPFRSELSGARIVRVDRRQFRILDGGRKDKDAGDIAG